MGKWLVFCLLVSVQSFAQLQMLARSGPQNSFRIEYASNFIDEAIVLDNQSGVYINSFFNQTGSVGIQYFDLKENRSSKLFELSADFRLSTPFLNNTNKLIFAVYDQEKTYGFIEQDVLSGTYRELYKFSEESQIITSHLFLLNGDLSFRSFDRKAGRFSLLGIRNYEIGEIKQSLPQDTSYLFGPCFNSKGDMAYKVRVSASNSLQESEKDYLLYRSSEGNLYTILEDHDAKPESPYAKILNHCSINEKGEIIQVVERLTGEKELLILRQSGQWSVLLREGEGDIEQIEYFPAPINNWSEILVRVIAKNHLRQILLIDSQGKLLQKIEENQMVMTDQDNASLRHVNPSFPSFSGTPALSDKGFAFVSFLTAVKEDENLGLGVFYFKLRD